MRRMSIIALALALGLALGLPASANPGRGPCTGGAPGAFAAGVIPVAPGPEFGPFFSEAAKQGGGLGDVVAEVQAAFCG